MQQHELNGRTIILVEVPEGAHCFQSMISKSLMYYTVPESGHGIQGAKNVEPDFTLLATTDTITEEQAAELVESLDGDLGEYLNNPQHRNHIVKFYKDYNHDGKLNNWLPSPLASFSSWLASIGITHNCAILVKQ